MFLPKEAMAGASVPPRWPTQKQGSRDPPRLPHTWRIKIRLWLKNKLSVDPHKGTKMPLQGRCRQGLAAEICPRFIDHFSETRSVLKNGPVCTLCVQAHAQHLLFQGG